MKEGLITLVWGKDLSALAWWRALHLRLARILFVIGRDLADGQLTLRAMSLVYTTLLSLVPLLAISFSVLKGFGVHNQVEPILFNFLEPLGEQGVEIATRLTGFVEKIEVGVLGSLGMALLIYTVISLMQKIERAFNYTWHVSRQRTLTRRFSDYLSVVLIGPVLIAASLGISASIMGAPVIQQLTAIQPIGSATRIAGEILPFVINVAAFTFFYVFIPNTKVRLGSALCGALTAGILWKLMGLGFAAFILGSTKYAAIYSAFATLIIFLIWLYLSWLILMVGAATAFYHQHPQYMTRQRTEMRLSNRVKERLALLVLGHIAKDFYGPAQMVGSAEELALAIDAPADATLSILETLEEAGFVIRGGADGTGYLPARPLETTPIIDALRAIRIAEEKNFIGPENLPGDGLIDRLTGDMDAAMEMALRGRSLRDLAHPDPHPADQDSQTKEETSSQAVERTAESWLKG